VEVALGDVDVAGGIRSRLLGERAPVAVVGLVGPDRRSGDREVKRDADRLDRGGDEVGIAVGERDELPAPSLGLGERGGHLGEDWPGRQRAAEGVALALGHRSGLLGGELGQALRHDVAVGRRRLLGLDAGLGVVVPGQEAGVVDAVAEQPRELRGDPGAPVDERAVAVEGRPPVGRGRVGHGAHPGENATALQLGAGADGAGPAVVD
jgi:hypothetical protein